MSNESGVMSRESGVGKSGSQKVRKNGQVVLDVV